MSSVPDTLTLARHRDRKGWVGPWPHRIGLGLLGAIVVAALLNVFGRQTATSTAATSTARLQIYAPTQARSGLIYTARFRTDALRQIDRALLVLAPARTSGYTFTAQRRSRPANRPPPASPP